MDSGYSLYMYVSVRYSGGMILPLLKISSWSCVWYGSCFECSQQYFARWYIPVYTSNTRSTSGFHTTTGSISGFPTAVQVPRVQYSPRRVFYPNICSISTFDALDILFEYTRSIWPSVVPLTYGTPSSRCISAASTRYTLEYRNTLSTSSIQSTEPRYTASTGTASQVSNMIRTYCTSQQHHAPTRLPTVVRTCTDTPYLQKSQKRTPN